MGANTHRIKDDREVIKYGTSQGVTIGTDQLASANIPLGTKVVVEELDDEPGLKVQPPKPDQIYHRDKIRRIVELGNSHGVLFKADELANAQMPVDTEVEVIELAGEPGVKVIPDSN